MQVTSPETETTDEPPPQEKTAQETSKDDVTVSPASIEMLGKLFPNKKRAVLELVLKRCNHDLLKAIEHFNLNKHKSTLCGNESDSSSTKEESASAFKPVANISKTSAKPSSYMGMHAATVPMISSEVFSFYPFFPLFPKPVIRNPVYVPGFCDCDQCKHNLYSGNSVDNRP